MTHNELNAKYYHEKRQELIKLLGGKCVRCGSTENLEFDHIDPFTKCFAISSKVTSPSILKTELHKIQLLCHTCHRYKTLYEDGSEFKRMGILNPQAKLTTEQVIEIRTKYNPNTYSYNMLAKEYGVSKTTIIDIVKMRHRLES